MTSLLALNCLELSVAQQNHKTAKEKVEKLQREIRDEKIRLRDAIWHQKKIMIKPFSTATRGKTLIRARIRRTIKRLYHELLKAKREAEITQFLFDSRVKRISRLIDENSNLVESILL